MFADLMTSRRFAPLFWTQFFSAFNDNFVPKTNTESQTPTCCLVCGQCLLVKVER